MEPEVPQEPAAPQQPEAPQPIDPRMALEIAAQQYGMTPDELESSMRLQEENRRVYEENRRRGRELEVREAELNALARERRQYAPPEPTYEIDPVVRPLYNEVTELKKMFLEERREKAQEAQRLQDANRLGQELNSHYQSVMRYVPSQSKVDPEQFFGAMAELWPDGPPPGVPAAQAVERTARYLGIRTNGYAAARPSPYQYGDPNRNPRAPIVIPAGPMQSDQPQVMNQFGSIQDIISDRPGETAEQKSLRLQAALESLAPGFRGLADGTKVTSGY